MKKLYEGFNERKVKNPASVFLGWAVLELVFWTAIAFSTVIVFKGFDAAFDALAVVFTHTFLK